MLKFMGWVLVLLSLLKVLDWKGFANAFAMYDIVAKKSRLYAFAYPAIEFGMGVSFLYGWNIQIASIILFIVMAVGSIGVTRNIFSKNQVRCACLGTLINVPLNKFTFFEDIVMAIMAIMILLGF